MKYRRFENHDIFWHTICSGFRPSEGGIEEEDDFFGMVKKIDPKNLGFQTAHSSWVSARRSQRDKLPSSIQRFIPSTSPLSVMRPGQTKVEVRLPKLCPGKLSGQRSRCKRVFEEVGLHFAVFLRDSKILRCTAPVSRSP
jgi:hypothetical protein